MEKIDVFQTELSNFSSVVVLNFHTANSLFKLILTLININKYGTQFQEEVMKELTTKDKKE